MRRAEAIELVADVLHADRNRHLIGLDASALVHQPSDTCDCPEVAERLVDALQEHFVASTGEPLIDE